MNIYDFKANDYLGNEVDLSIYKGQVVLIVNTATRCGFTPQYEGLEALYEKYKDQGFVILDFPCNQFLAQAPGSSEEIHSACTLRFGTKFPQFEKIKVNGKGAHPLFEYLESQNEKGKVKKVKWNFTKFLIGRDGSFLGRFEPTCKPAELESPIVEALKK
ncbi:MAG: glutathione peroxidase [Bacilli bacterium]|nr:glutathione peroxidase [Bacilli bacterium]